jgi:hypothetical protein
LRQIVESTSDGTLEKFIEILFKVGLVDDVAGTHEKVMTTFDRIVELLLGASRVGDLERVMMKVRGLTGPEGDLVFENLEAINRIFDRWGTADLITRIAEKINDPHIEDAAPLLTLLRLQNPGAAAHIARAAGLVTIPERRAAVFELLPEIIPGQLKEIARILQSCDATHAHDLIRVLRSLEGVDILTAINGALNNPDAAVRLEALGNLPPDKLHLYLQYILNALKDKSKVVRGKAVHLLARMPSPQVHGHLLQRIRDKDFAEVDLDEKRRFFAAASLTGKPDGVVHGAARRAQLPAAQGGRGDARVRGHRPRAADARAGGAGLRAREVAQVAVGRRARVGAVGHSARATAARGAHAAALRHPVQGHAHLRQTGGYAP